MFDRLVTLLMFPGNTSEATELKRSLVSIETEPLAAPTHASSDERKRAPYDRETIVASASGKTTRSIQLWRTKSPKYADGALSANNKSHNKLGVDYQASLPAEKIRELYAAWTRLAEAFRPEFGFVHQVWEADTPEAEAYSYGIRLSLKDLRTYGFCKFHPRNWFGPDLLSVVGKERLLSLPFSRPTSWGGVELDLVENPWEADFEALYKRQQEVVRIFAAWGLMGDYSNNLQKRPGPNWTPRVWNV